MYPRPAISAAGIPAPAFRSLRLQNPDRFRFENTAAEEKALLLTALETAVKIKRSRGRRGPSELSETKRATIKKLAFLRSARVSLSEPASAFAEGARGILTDYGRAAHEGGDFFRRVC